MQTWPNLHDSKPVSVWALLYFAVLSVLCAVAMNPPAVLILTFVTFGLGGFVLFNVHTLMIYSLALLPVYFWFRSRRRWGVLAIAIVPVLLLAVGPGLVAIYLAAEYAAAHTSDDFIAAPALRPTVLELIRDDRRERGTLDERATCEDFCQRLLINGEVRTLRVTMLLPRETRSTTYTVEQRQQCPRTPPPITGPKVNIIRQYAALGTCLIADNADDTPIDASIFIATERASDADKVASFYFRPSTIQRLVIKTKSGEIVRQQTRVGASRLAIPFRITLKGLREVGIGGPIAVRLNDRFDDWDLVGVVRQTFNFSASLVPPPQRSRPQL